MDRSPHGSVVRRGRSLLDFFGEPGCVSAGSLGALTQPRSLGPVHPALPATDYGLLRWRLLPARIVVVGEQFLDALGAAAAGVEENVERLLDPVHPVIAFQLRRPGAAADAVEDGGEVEEF